MKTMNSTAITGIEYSEGRRELTIVFSSGHAYVYAGVSRRTRDQLVKAESVGKAYHQLIRGRYQSTKVTA